MSDHDGVPAAETAGHDGQGKNVDAEYEVDGLIQSVEIIVDTWGVPHIYAEHRADAFVAQGFQAARDRLFQIDLWRRRGLGRLSEVLGEAYVDQDRAARLFLYRGDMRAEWLSYATEAQDIVRAFVAGVNAYIGWALEAPMTRLPPEFGELGYDPEPVQPEDIVRIRTHGLLYNAEQELSRALTIRDLGVEGEAMRSVQEPAQTRRGSGDDDLCDHLDDDALALYRLAFAPVDLDRGRRSTPLPSGSNNWAISAQQSHTGRPILANDPHRAIGLPSLRYLSHLEAPGLRVAGAGEPFLPGVSIGHNDRVAFSLSIWPIDHEDLYIYQLHPSDDDRYLYQGAWEQFTVVRESAGVAHSDDVEHTLVFSRHGPVVHIDTDTRHALAVRAAWLEPGMAPYLGSLEYLDAHDATDFTRALRRWGAPGVNQIYATVDGDIGWQASGLVPHRVGWDGSLPVPGDGRFEWNGFMALDELPSHANPERGWVAAANEFNLPGDFSDELTITTDWYSPARARHIESWLRSGAVLDIASSLDMQMNVDNTHGLDILQRLSHVTIAAHANVWADLQAWDGVESAQSRETLIFQVWLRRHFRPWLVDQCLGQLGGDAARLSHARRRLLRDDTLFSELRPLLRMLGRINTATEEGRALLSGGVSTTLAAALAEIEQLLGSHRAEWRWGAVHRTRMVNSVFDGKEGVPPQWAHLPPLERSGSGDSVGLSGYDADFNAVAGSSFRMVLDVGSWDNSRVINTPGQSGDPRSRHYADLFPLWGADETFPLLFSRPAVEAAASHRIMLHPR